MSSRTPSRSPRARSSRSARASPRRAGSPLAPLNALFGSNSPGARNSLFRRSSTPRKGLSAEDSALSFDSSVLFHDRVLWYYIFVTVIVFLVVLAIVNNNNLGLTSWARLPVWMANQYLLALIFALILILAMHSTYIGHHAGVSIWKSSLGMSYLVLGIFLAILAALVFRSHNFTAAFWLALVGFILSCFHFYGVWRLHALAGYEFLPLVVFLGYATYKLWFMSAEACDLSSCLVVYAAE